VALQRDEVVEGLDLVQFCGMDQAHGEVADPRSIQDAIEQPVLAMQDRPLQGAFADVMPTAGLCRGGGSRRAAARFLWLLTRHNPCDLLRLAILPGKGLRWQCIGPRRLCSPGLGQRHPERGTCATPGHEREETFSTTDTIAPIAARLSPLT
jgi:hypothetical protein